MDNQRYFPPLYGGVECGECDMAAVCHSCGKYQRDRRDFTYTSGRCPRLPDRRGFVDKSQKKLYAETFPLVHAERGDESLTLSLSIPGEKRLKKVYLKKDGYWYFRERAEDRSYIRRRINFNCFQSMKDVLDYMNLYDADYCLFRVVIMDCFF